MAIKKIRLENFQSMMSLFPRSLFGCFSRIIREYNGWSREKIPVERQVFR